MTEQYMYDSEGYILAEKPSKEVLSSMYEKGYLLGTLTYQSVNYLRLLEGVSMSTSRAADLCTIMWFGSMCWKHKDHLLSEEDVVSDYVNKFPSTPVVVDSPKSEEKGFIRKLFAKVY